MPLSVRVTSLVRVSALAAAPGDRDELYSELRTIRQDDVVSREELYEAFLQLYLFAGFPASLEAMRGLEHTWPLDTMDLAERAEAAAVYTNFREKGESLYKRVYADNADRVREEMLKLSPELAAWAVVEGYGKTLSRRGLDTITRELCIVGILTQLEWERQLYSHILGARNVGASTDAILDAVRIGALGDEKKFFTAEQLVQKVV